MRLGRIFLVPFLFVFLALVPASVLASGGQPFRLAVIGALSGEASASNKAMFQAARYAVDEINASGGLLGRDVDLLVYDNQSSAIGSRVAARQAITAGADAAIGASWSAHSLAITPVFEEAGIPMITPMSTNPEVTKGRRYVFRTCFTDAYQGKAMADFAYRDLKVRNVVIFCNVDRIYSEGLADAFETEFIRLGGKISWRGEFLLDVADYSALLGKAASFAPDAVFLPGDYRDSSFIIGQARKMGLDFQFIGGDSFGERLYDYIGKLADGCYYSTHWRKDNPSPRSRAFVEKYEAVNGEIRQTSIPMTYDAVMLWADAVRRAGVADRAAVRDALAATRGFPGVAGVIGFEGSGDPVRAVVINRLENGGAVFVEEIVP